MEPSGVGTCDHCAGCEYHVAVLGYRHVRTRRMPHAMARWAGPVHSWNDCVPAWSALDATSIRMMWRSRSATPRSLLNPRKPRGKCHEKHPQSLEKGPATRAPGTLPGRGWGEEPPNPPRNLALNASRSFSFFWEVGMERSNVARARSAFSERRLREPPQSAI
jgi:hypothetical protein